MDPTHLILLAVQVSILLTVFAFGLKTTLDDLALLMRRPRLLIRSLLAVFVLMPIGAVLLARAFNFPRVTEIALIALSISPMPPLLPQKEIKAGGATSYALGLMAILALLAVITVPLALAIFARLSARPLTMAPANIARIVLMTTLVPLAAGLAVNALLPRVAASIQKPVSVTAKSLLFLGAGVLLVAIAPVLWAAVGNGTLLAIFLFLAIGLAVGHVLGGPEPDQSVVLALSTACRHPGIALSIAATNFPDQNFDGAILLYVVLGVLVGTPYVLWQRRQMRTAPAV